MKSLTVIIPCYNEEPIIVSCYQRLKAVLDGLELRCHILFVNDGSTDGTLAQLRIVTAQDPQVKVISFSRNFGHQAAVTAGIHHTDSDLAVIMDADLQDPPELIPQLLIRMDEEQANVVYCVRRRRLGESKLRLWWSRTFYRTLNRASEMKFPLDTGDFRLIDRRVMEQFCRLHEKGKYVRGLISWVGFKQVAFHYVRNERVAGHSKYPFHKMWSFGFNALLYFSKKPLQLATGLGFVAVFIGIAMAIWYALGKVYGYTNAESGWTSLMIAIIFFGGIQLLTIGVLGQYIGVLFDEIKDRPEYIIDEIVNTGDEYAEKHVTKP